MTTRVFKRTVFMISMLIIITHSGCKKNAGEDYQLPVATPTMLSPHLSTGWTALGNLPDNFRLMEMIFYWALKTMCSPLAQKEPYGNIISRLIGQ